MGSKWLIGGLEWAHFGPIWTPFWAVLGDLRSPETRNPKPYIVISPWRHPSERCYRQGIRDAHLHGHLGIALKVYIRVYGIMACTLYGTSPPSAAPFRPHI